MTSIPEGATTLMVFPDDVRKALTDSKHLYFVAGAGELAVNKLREVPGRLASLRVEPHVAADRVQNAIFDAQARLSETLSTPPDVRSLPRRAQGFALTSLGRAGEALIRAHDGYEELAERGRTVVERLRTPQRADAEPTADEADEEDVLGGVDQPAAGPSDGAGKRPSSASGGAGRTGAKPTTGKPTTGKPATGKTSSAKTSSAKSAGTKARRGASGKASDKAADPGDTSGTA